MNWNAEQAIIVAIALVLIIALFAVVLFYYFSKRKDELLEQQQEERVQYKQAMTDSQLEIQEQILRNISWELHDNIGQQLMLSKIIIQNIENDSPEIIEAVNSIDNALKEVRALAQSLNLDVLKTFSLEQAIRFEIERFNRLNFVRGIFILRGSPFDIDPEHQMFLFRILQEFFSNTIRHSKARTLTVSLEYQNELLILIANDDGIGFNADLRQDGLGIRNIAARAELIGATVKLQSQQKDGTSLRIIYPKPNSWSTKNTK